MDKKVPYFLEDTSPLLEGRLTPSQLPIFHQRAPKKVAYALLITQISKNDYTDFFYFRRISNLCNRFLIPACRQAGV
jgi:hypothetical protein